MASEAPPSEFVAKGKVTAVRDDGRVVVFAPANTNYEIHLVAASGKYDGPVGKPVEGVIRVKARKVWTVASGGNFISPLFGEPRTIQGRVRLAGEERLVVLAGTDFQLDLPDVNIGIVLTAGPIRVGTMVNVMSMPGATFDNPTTIAFFPDGRMLVGEKAGIAWMVSNSGTRLPTPVWSRELEVLNEGDKGLLAVAVDPDFFLNHYVYYLYTVDPDSNGVDDNNSDAFGRLTRYQMSAVDTNVVDPDSRTILFGRVWSEGPTIGMRIPEAQTRGYDDGALHKLLIKVKVGDD